MSYVLSKAEALKACVVNYFFFGIRKSACYLFQWDDIFSFHETSLVTAAMPYNGL